MSDPLDDALAYMDSTLAPEEAPQDDEGTPSDPPRDEQGRFTTEPEPEVEAEETAEPDEEESLLAGKYKSAEDLERAYKELESRLGSQGSELAELRRAFETREEPRPQAPLNQSTMDWFEQQADTNPYGAAVWAMQNDPSGVLYNRAMDSWYDIEPRQAAAFERQLEVQQLRTEFNQQIQKTAAPLAEQEMARAFRAASDAHPDVKENLPQLLQAAVENSPVVTQSLIDAARNGDYDTKVQVFAGLIALAKGQQAGVVAQAVQGAADEDAARSRAMKQSGGVATQTQAVQADTVSSEEQWLRDNFDRYLAPE